MTNADGQLSSDSHTMVFHGIWATAPHKARHSGKRPSNHANIGQSSFLAPGVSNRRFGLQSLRGSASGRSEGHGDA